MECQIMGKTASTVDHLVMRDPEIIEDPPDILLEGQEFHLMAHPMVLQEVEMMIMALEEVATMTPIVTAVAEPDTPGPQLRDRFHLASTGIG